MHIKLHWKIITFSAITFLKESLNRRRESFRLKTDVNGIEHVIIVVWKCFSMFSLQAFPVLQISNSETLRSKCFKIHE